MKIKNSWLEQKKSAFCILLGICAVALFVIFNMNKKIQENKGGSYVIKIRHYGVDAEEMERTVTIPLEDALFAVPGISQLQSSSENGVSVVFIRSKSSRKNGGNYEAVRDAAQRVYETLPPSAQRPEIISSGNSKSFNSRIPVWSSAVFSNEDKKDIAFLLEKTVKPRLESLEGAGEVIVSGVGNKQILIILDQEKLAAINLDVHAVATALALNDSIFSAGSVLQNSTEIIVTVDGRYKDDQSLKNALIPLGEGKYVTLSDIAVITECEKEPDILSRLNGKRAAGIAIMGQDKTSLRKLSSNIKKELDGMNLPLEFIVLSDLGAEDAKAFRSVLNASLSGAIMVAIISLLLNAVVLRGIFCAMTIPIVCLISIACLSIWGYSIDKLMLAGIAAGIGTAVDAVILTSEKLRLCKDFNTAKKAIKELTGPLTAGAATTAVALLPLMRIHEVKIIAVSIAAVCIAALAVSLTLLPPLLMWKKRTSHSGTTAQRNKFRLLCRLLARNVRFCSRYPAVVLGAAIVLSAAAIFAFLIKGADTSSYGSEDSVYAQVEFDAGLLPEEVDRLLADYSIELSEHTGIKNVETGARTGSGSLLISFDTKITQANIVRDLAKNTAIPGGFVFFHENSSQERYWEIKVYGNEDKKCREIAEELAYNSVNSPIVRDRVLNFKKGSDKLVLIPDREIFAEAGIAFSDAGNKIRTGVYGPVIYKRINALQGNENGEIDVRITNRSSYYGSLRQSREETLNLLVSGSNGTLHIDTLMQKKDTTEPSGIRRDDRRRTASITITTDPMDPRRVKKVLLPVFDKIDLPPGYSIEFDPEAIQQANSLTATVLSFILSILFCYMIIASINESFISPLIVLAAIPPSLSIPAICLALSGSAYNLAIACAFIAVSGMTVNAAVLCVDGLQQRQNIYSALRKKIPALLATSVTTAAGAIPFLFLREDANYIMRTISLVGALGVIGSCICSITLIPSIYFFKKRIHSKS